MFRLRSCASSMISVSYWRELRVALRLGEQDAVGHQLDVARRAGAVGEADLEADRAAELGLQLVRRCARRWRARRCGAAGCGRSAPRSRGRARGRSSGSWVVLPEPVSPQTITTWWSRIARAISSRFALTGSSGGNSGRGRLARRRASSSAPNRGRWVARFVEPGFGERVARGSVGSVTRGSLHRRLIAE